MTNNTTFPYGIAVDQYENLFVTNGTGIAVDDAAGNSIFANITTPMGASAANTPYYSVTIGGSNVYAFCNASAYGTTTECVNFGDGWAAMDGRPLPVEAYGLTKSSAPVGSSCSGAGMCWWTDSANEALDVGSVGLQYSMSPLASAASTAAISLQFVVPLGYVPAGIAYDQTRNRLFVTDPTNNAIHVYNATTMTLERTLT